MGWLLLSIACAFFLATADAFTKKYFTDLSPFEMGTVRLLYTLPWLGTCMIFMPKTMPDPTFFLCISIAIPLEILALTLYMKAIKLSDISISLPYFAFTPVFLILTGRIILGEKLSIPGISGIVLIAAGSYIMNISKIRSGLASPLLAIYHEKGSRLVLVVALIYSVTAAIGKVAIIHSNPYFFGAVYYSVFTIITLSLFAVIPDTRTSSLVARPFAGIVLGGLMGMMILTHMLAISMTEAAYMISIKRTSLIFSVIYGALVFKEAEISQRLAGTIIMTAGVLVIGFLA